MWPFKKNPQLPEGWTIKVRELPNANGIWFGYLFDANGNKVEDSGYSQPGYEVVASRDNSRRRLVKRLTVKADWEYRSRLFGESEYILEAGR